MAGERRPIHSRLPDRSDSHRRGDHGPANPPIEAGIGGCGTQALIEDIARHTKVFAYEWSPRAGPGIVQSPGYANGAGHASELAYLWPSFEQNGVRISSLFDSGERELSHQIVEYWGAFVKAGAPRVAGQPSWPPYTATSAVQLSLRAQGHSRLLGNATISAETTASLEQADGELTLDPHGAV